MPEDHTLTHPIKTTAKLNTPNKWARAIAESLKDYEIDAETLFNSLGMDYSRLSDEDGYYLQDQVTRLWNAAAEASNDPLFGLKTGFKIQSTSYPALGYALMASKDFLACCKRMVRFQDVLAEGLYLELKQENQQYAFVFGIKDCDLPPSQHAVDAMFSSFLNFTAWLTQKHVNPVRATLQRKAPQNPVPFDDIFNCPIDYSCNQNCLFFTNENMHFPLATADEVIANIHDDNVSRLLEKQLKGNTTSNVRNLIIDGLPKGEPKQDTIAEHMNISTSTLKRRLSEENTRFKSLLDETRAQLAIGYLQQSHLSLTRIAELLGFSETSGFNRAFKRWKGISPKQWQKQNTQ